VLAVFGLLLVLGGSWGLLWACGTAVEQLTRTEFETQAFDHRTWVAHHGDYESPRGRMLDDLLRTRLKLGMKRPEILSLLGQPDEKFPPIPPAEDPAVRTKGDGYGYFAGPYYGCVFQLLDIQFSPDGVVVDIFLHRPRDICND
jgi:hypothetical protein